MSTTNEDTKWYSYTSSTQTMRTWARRIDTLSDVPQEFQAAFPKIREQFPYTVYQPEEKAGKNRPRDKKLICVFEDHFVLLESVGGEIVARSGAFADVLYLRRGQVLLDSWIHITTSEGLFELHFNTVNEKLFDPIMAAMRQKMTGAGSTDAPSAAESNADLSMFDSLDKLNYKFMNYGRLSVRQDATVLGVIYQPEQSIQTLRLFNKTLYRRYKTDHLAILTDMELILIQEEKQIRNNFDPQYGGVFTYIPRHQIENISFAGSPELDSDQLIMEIGLPANCSLAVEFSAAHEDLPIDKWKALLQLDF